MLTQTIPAPRECYIAGGTVLITIKLKLWIVGESDVLQRGTLLIIAIFSDQLNNVIIDPNGPSKAVVLIDNLAFGNPTIAGVHPHNALFRIIFEGGLPVVTMSYALKQLGVASVRRGGRPTQALRVRRIIAGLAVLPIICKQVDGPRGDFERLQTTVVLVGIDRVVVEGDIVSCGCLAGHEATCIEGVV